MFIVGSLDLDSALCRYFDYNAEVCKQLRKVNAKALGEGVTDIVVLGISKKSAMSYNANLLLNDALDKKLVYHFVLSKSDIGVDNTSPELILKLAKRNNVKIYTTAGKLGKLQLNPAVGNTEPSITFKKKTIKASMLPLMPTSFSKAQELRYADATGKLKFVAIKADVSLVEIRTSQLRKPKPNEIVKLIVDTKDDFSKFQGRHQVASITREAPETKKKIKDGVDIQYNLSSFIESWLENSNLPVKELMQLRKELTA